MQSHTHTNNGKKKKGTEPEQTEKGMLRGGLLPWESLLWWPSSLATSCWEAARWCRRTPQTACHLRRTWSRRCFLCLQLWTEQHDSEDSCGQNNMTVKTAVDRTTWQSRQTDACKWQIYACKPMSLFGKQCVFKYNKNQHTKHVFLIGLKKKKKTKCYSDKFTMLVLNLKQSVPVLTHSDLCNHTVG